MLSLLYTRTSISCSYTYRPTHLPTSRCHLFEQSGDPDIDRSRRQNQGAGCRSLPAAAAGARRARLRFRGGRGISVSGVVSSSCRLAGFAVRDVRCRFRLGCSRVAPSASRRLFSVVFGCFCAASRSLRRNTASVVAPRVVVTTMITASGAAV